MVMCDIHSLCPDTVSNIAQREGSDGSRPASSWSSVRMVYTSYGICNWYW